MGNNHLGKSGVFEDWGNLAFTKPRSPFLQRWTKKGNPKSSRHPTKMKKIKGAQRENRGRRGRLGKIRGCSPGKRLVRARRDQNICRTDRKLQHLIHKRHARGRRQEPSIEKINGRRTSPSPAWITRRVPRRKRVNTVYV